ncbi:EcsC family protein [uncultured Aeromicrobium sp.]|uniref:EcsC family protein n=1 Tax=uncultured Aeromicrobium sp. TaxID=337820 RepID=UPI0025E0C406|nr:EcsC family protein [uncultured Aeromicrobium sp.]
MKDIVEKSLTGTLEVTFNPALRSASVENALRGYQKRYPDVQKAEHLKTLDLEALDRFRRRKGLYVSTSAVQGTATSLAVTGTMVASTVSGGVASGTVLVALASDTLASLAIMGRSVGSVAVRYGYDVRLPDEELFAMGVLTIGTAGTLEAKYAAMGALSRLSQQMMRRATWKQLNEQVVVRAISRVYQALGLKLTQRKLAQTVPVVGVGLNATLNANMTRHVYQRAEDVYRIRFLSDKYGIDPQMWIPADVADDVDPGSGEELPDVVAILEEEQERRVGRREQ